MSIFGVAIAAEMISVQFVDRTVADTATAPRSRSVLWAIFVLTFSLDPSRPGWSRTPGGNLFFVSRLGRRLHWQGRTLPPARGGGGSPRRMPRLRHARYEGHLSGLRRVPSAASRSTVVLAREGQVVQAGDPGRVGRL